MADRTVTYRFIGDVSGLVSSMAAAGTSVKSLGTQMTALDAKGARMRAGLTTVGSAAGKLGLVAAGGLAASAKAAIDWESDWAGVMKTVDGSSSQLQALEGDLREMARSMPATHTEIAQVAEAAGQLGVATGDVASFTKTMIMLGETTNLSADEAATSIAQMANVMGTAPGDIDNVGAALVALGNDGASTESQILGMAQRISAAGAQIGLTESDILAIANASASMGVEVEAGGTAISTVFTEMAKATKTGGSELEDFARTAGMSGEQFIKAFQDDPAQAFASFVGGLDQVNKSGGNVFGLLEDLGLNGVRVSQSLLGLASSGDLLTDSLDLGASAFEENSALMTEYGKRADTTASEMQVAWNNIKDAGIDIGAAALPALGQLAQQVSTVTGAFQSLPAPVKSSVTALLGLTAVTGGGLWFGSKVIGGIASAKEALASLGVEAATTRTRMGTLAKGAGIAALAVGTIDWGFDAFDTGKRSIAQFSQEGADSIDDLAYSLNQTNFGKYAGDFGIDIDRFAGELVRFGTESDYYKQSMDRIKSASGEGWTGAAKGLGSFLNPLTTDTEKANLAQNALGSVMADNKGLIGSAANEASAAVGATDAYGNAVSGAGDMAAEASSAITSLATAMRSQADAAVSAFDAQTGWGQAVAEAQAAADKGARGIDAMTESGRENRNALSGLAQAWAAQSPAIRNNLGEYTKARQTFLEFADSMGVPQRQAQRLADSMLQIPRRLALQMALEGAATTEEKLALIGTELERLGQKKATPQVIAETATVGASLGLVMMGMNQVDRKTATPNVGVTIGAATAGIGNVRTNLSRVDKQRTNPKITADGIGALRTSQNVRGALSGLDRTTATPSINAQDNASGVIAGIRAGIAGIQSKTVTITTIQQTIQRARRAFGLPNAEGGYYPRVERYAHGGFGGDPRDKANAHVAELAMGGPMRVWREPETQGEAYVPLANDYRRPRAKSIAEQVVEQFGGEVEWYAKGGASKKAKAARAKATERRRDLRQAARDFNPQGDDTRAEIRKALRTFRREWEKAGRDWTKAQKRQAAAITQVSTRYRKLNKQLEDNRDDLKKLKDARNDYRKSTAESFNNDIFGDGVAGLRLQLEADRNDSRSMLAAIKAANKRGLNANSGLAKALMESGDLNTAQQLAKMSRREIDSLESLYANRAQAQNALGNYASSQVYAKAIDKQSRLVDRQDRTLTRLNRRLDNLEGRLERGVARGAAAGSARGARANARAANKRVAARAKAGRR